LKKQLLTVAIINVLLILFTGTVYAQTTYDWTGGSVAVGNQTDWTNTNNWQSTIGGVTTSPATTYPGQSGSTDIVQIGVNPAVPSFTSYPVLANNITIASLTFGTNGPQTDGGFQTFTVNSILTVSGDILQMHPTAGTLESAGDCSAGNPGAFTYPILTILEGTGTINCLGNFRVGDNTNVANNFVANVTEMKIATTTPTHTTLAVNVTGNLVMNSTSTDDGSLFVSNNNAVFTLTAGTLTVGGTLELLNNESSASLSYGCDIFAPFADFTIDITDTDNPVLNLAGSTPVFINTANPGIFNTIDFYNPNGGTGNATVNYSGTSQPVYTNNTTSPTNVVDEFVDNTDGSYQNLTFSGSGTKTLDAGTFTIAGNLTLATPTPANTITVDATTNSPELDVAKNYSSVVGTTLNYGGTNLFTIAGNITNGGVFNASATAALTLKGAVNNTGSMILSGSGSVTMTANYTTSGTGTYIQTAGTTIFSRPGAQTLIGGAGAGTQFNNVTFSSSTTNTKTMSTGNFFVGSKGVLTLAGKTTLAVAAAGSLTLNSDANSTASVAVIPANCAVTGNVNVQRFVTGGVGYRGYRMLSSPVNTGTSANGIIYTSLNYIAAGMPTTGSGGTAGGFTQAGNPTLYLFRENLVPSNATFTSGNFRGVANISVSPSYTIDIDGPGFKLPVGAGVLMFFRGGNTTVNPFITTTVPDPATFTATGLLNQGSYTYNDWYSATPTSHTLGFTTVSGDPTVEGFNLIGNPYASSVDWSKYSTTTSTAGFYAPKVAGNPGVTSFVYTLHSTGQGNGNYGIYDAATGLVQNGGTNIIPSGMGFFVISANNAATLTINETAKTTTQPAALNLFLGKPPVATNVLQYLRLQLAKDSVETDETLINFDANAANAYAFGEDAPYKIGTGKVSLSSLSSDNKTLAINKMPLAAGRSIPLKLNAAADGAYTLNMAEIAAVPQVYAIWLKDAFTKDSVNMRTTKTKSFNITLADTNTYKNRFSVVLRQDPALAYKLLQFDANKTNNRQVEVVWKTVNEQNYTRFTVERSTDKGKTFDVIGNLTSSGEGTYSLLDKSPAKGDNLYRLKQVDFNHTITYSKVVQVEFTGKANDLAGVRLYIFPNPVINTITLTIDPKSQEAGTYHITITNSTGLVVKQLVTAQTTWQENISRLLTGTYLVQVVNNKDNSIIGQTKFVKL